MSISSLPTESDRHGIDFSAVTSHFGGDQALLHDVIELFLADWPQRVAALHNALERGDSQDLRIVAHSLKGSLQVLGAQAAAAAAAALEQCGKEGTLNQARGLCDVLERELAAVVPLLTQLIRDDASALPPTKPC